MKNLLYSQFSKQLEKIMLLYFQVISAVRKDCDAIGHRFSGMLTEI